MNKITKPNKKNLNKKYWEKVLRSHGLGVDQPLTDNSTNADESVVSLAIGIASSPAKDREILREKIDADDPLIFSHEIKTIRTMEREIPEWVFEDSKIRKILLAAFPKLENDEKQRARAGFWMRVIHLYYRMGLPRQIVAKELGVSEENLNNVIQRLSRAASGSNTAGKLRKNSKTK